MFAIIPRPPPLPRLHIYDREKPPFVFAVGCERTVRADRWMTIGLMPPPDDSLARANRVDEKEGSRIA